MKEKLKNIVYIDSDLSSLQKQKIRLSGKNLNQYLSFFNHYEDALEFIENQIVRKSKKLHYILINLSTNTWPLTSILERIEALNNTTNKLEVIVHLPERNKRLKNRIIQNPVVTAFSFNPIADNYIEFLITGRTA